MWPFLPIFQDGDLSTCVMHLSACIVFFVVVVFFLTKLWNQKALTNIVDIFFTYMLYNVHFQVLSYQTFPLSHQESPRNSVKWNHRVRYLFLIFLHLTKLKEAKKLHNGDWVNSNPMSFIEHNFTIHSFIILYLSGQCISSYFLSYEIHHIS